MVLSAFVHQISQLGSFSPGALEELQEEAEEIERRITAAEEQAAAAWDLTRKLEKDLETLRQGTAETIEHLERALIGDGRA